MKKIIPIIAFISGIGVTVGASIIMKAEEISYTPNDTEWNVSDVRSAIDDLNARDYSLKKVTINCSFNGSSVSNRIATCDLKSIPDYKFKVLWNDLIIVTKTISVPNTGSPTFTYIYTASTGILQIKANNSIASSSNGLPSIIDVYYR